MPRLPQLAALVAVAVLGGVAALGGAALLGQLDGSTTTVVESVSQSAAPASAAPSNELSVRDIYKRSASGVVQITASSQPQMATDPFSGTEFPAQQALGSGFVVDKAGHVVTNYHVIEGADEIQVAFSNQKTLTARLVGSDPSTDLAVLQVEARPTALTPLPLADSDGVEVGDPVVAIGNPFGLERTVTAGIVSALQRAVIAPNGYTIDQVIQTDAPINKGNSGGPLLDALARVIGVNSQIETAGTSDGNVGIGFAVPSNTIKSVVAQLIETGDVKRAFVGVTISEVNEELARVARLPVDTGLLVQSVMPDSPADRAGLEGGTSTVVVSGESYEVGGDVIVGVDGTRVTSLQDLRDVLRDHAPGDTVKVEIYRGDKRKKVTVTLGDQPPAAG